MEKNTKQIKINKQLKLVTKERWAFLITLLNNSEEKFTVRKLAKRINSSIGFVSKFAGQLKDLGYLKNKRTIEFADPRKLLDEMRNQYSFENNQIQSYFSELTPEEFIKRIQAEAKKNKLFYALTRMAGANQVAPFVRFQTVDFYVKNSKDVKKWVEILNLQEVEISGNVNLVIPQEDFIWIDPQEKKQTIVINNIQLYLDLYKYPARGREQAEYLRDKVISF
ncbi:hypothetical protein KKG58_02235 [Patescibacteria group bacterium]|nr:hypothetical protein [Patescibacteria group bacterium]